MNQHALRPWQVSFLIHLSLAGCFLLLTFIRMPSSELIMVPIEVNGPKEVQQIVQAPQSPNVVLKSVNTPKEDEVPKSTRQVFGASRRSYTDEKGEGVEVKMGNTLAKEVDKEKLTAKDADTLPTATEEYLVSVMPVVLSEVRPVYPKEAEKENINGMVDMDVLIDEKGLVRQATVISGPEIFRSGAIAAMKKFKFRPAEVEGKPVAVRIRYSLEFKLER